MKEQNKIEIFKTEDNQTEISVKFVKESVWLNQKQMGLLFEKNSDTIGLHLKNIYKDGELEEPSTTEFFSVVQKEGKRNVQRSIKFYNLDAIISVGYRVNSIRGVQFRQWATQRLKDYLVKGYAINEKRLAQKQQELIQLKTGIQILSRAINAKNEEKDNEILNTFAKGLELLDDYDHKELDILGNTKQKTVFPHYNDYIYFIKMMYSDYKSDIFGIPKDESFKSSINQISQTFDGKELLSYIAGKSCQLAIFYREKSFFCGW